MLRLTIVILLLGICLHSAVAQTPFNVTINTRLGRKPISPYIYGSNDNYPHATAKRLGGNRLSGYNWENNASHSGEDLDIPQNDHYVPWILGVPAGSHNTPASAITFFHNRSLTQGAYSLITLPMAGYVAADASNQPVTNAQAAYLPDWRQRWRYVQNRKTGPLSLTPDINDDTVYVEEELNFLLNSFGRSNTPTGIKGYSLDNEPSLWPITHPLIFGTNRLRVDQLMPRSVELAKVIKDHDPTAEVFGPAAYGAFEFTTLQDAPDWNSYQAQGYPIFLAFYLDSMRKASVAENRRLLDVLDIHWYPEENFTSGTSPFDNATDPATNKARVDMTRSLWDPSYIESTWIGNTLSAELLPVLPKLNALIDQYYPGTKLAISEYDFGARQHISGGIAQADILGIFGQQRVYFATYWGAVEQYNLAGFDMYRNYDGQGGRFGSTSVSSATDNLEYSSVYASVDETDETKLHVILINKDPNNARNVNINIVSDSIYRGAKVWMFDGSNSAIRQLNNITGITGNAFTITLPAYSVYHLVVTTEDLLLHPDFQQASVSPAAGYSDGLSSFTITANVIDGNDNVTSVTADLSSVGGAANQALTRNGNQYTYTHLLPAGTPSGFRDLPIIALDADGNRDSIAIRYQVMRRAVAQMIWDGDALEAIGDSLFTHSPGDSRQGFLRLTHQTTGGNEEPGCLFLHMEHDINNWLISGLQFDIDDNSPVVTRDFSEHGYLEFYIRSNAPTRSEISVSLTDYNIAFSKAIPLKAAGYISEFNSGTYTRVRIPIADFVGNQPFDLTEVYRMNFHSDHASRGFDVWIDDVRLIPYSHPMLRPQISDSTITPTSNFADGQTSVTIEAVVTDIDNDLQSVTIDLSPLNGPNNAAMTLVNGRYTITHYLPANTLQGRKQLTITAADTANNSTQASLPFLVYQKAVSDTIWNGDSKATGAQRGPNWNANTVSTVLATGGNYRPGALQMHLEGMPAGLSAIVWDWNAGTNDGNLIDATQKRYLQFYVRVTGTAAQPNFDFQVFLQDPFDGATHLLPIRGNNYLSSFTGGYQLVQIPLEDLFNGRPIDRSRLARFGVLSQDVSAPAGIDVFLDDITISGSIVADVQLTFQDANCGSNGSIMVDDVVGGPGNYQYAINGVNNPRGSTDPEFSGLSSGTYDIKVTGDNNFIYVASVPIRGYSAINVATTSNGNNATALVSNGTGDYSYAWSNGSTTPTLTNVDQGVYTVTVTDNTSGCIASAQAVIGTVLADEQLSFTLAREASGFKLVWRGKSLPGLVRYEILHSSNGRNFTPVHLQSVDMEKEKQGQAYTFLHQQPVQGNNYYQVRLVFADGRTKVSTIRIGVFDQQEKATTAYPNPVINNIFLTSKQKIVDIELTDITGRKMSDFTWIQQSGGALVNMEKLQAGTYMLLLRHKGGVEKVKILKL